MKKVGETLCAKILIIQDTPSYHSVTPDLLGQNGYAFSIIELSAQVLDKINLQSPDLVIFDLGSAGADALDLCARLKADPFTRHIPIVILGPPNSTANRYRWNDSGADVYLDYPCHPDVIFAHIGARLRRSIDYDPVTRLPTDAYLHRMLDAWLANNIPTAILYTDIDHFSSYKAAYGEEAGLRVLLRLAGLIIEALPPDDLTAAYLGEDDFMIVLPPKGTDTVAQTLVDRFRGAQREFYNESDLANGYIQEMDPFLPARTWPLMTLSAAVVNNERRVLTNYFQVSRQLSRFMVQVKAQGGNNWAGDRP